MMHEMFVPSSVIRNRILSVPQIRRDENGNVEIKLNKSRAGEPGKDEKTSDEASIRLRSYQVHISRALFAELKKLNRNIVKTSNITMKMVIMVLALPLNTIVLSQAMDEVVISFELNKH